MTLTLAQMVRKVGFRIGLRLSQEPIGSTDLQLQQMVELFNEVVTEIGTRHRWQALTHEATFVTQNQEDQGEFVGGIVPEDSQFNFIISETMWDRTARQPIPGPDSSFDWQARHAVQYTSGPFPNYRLRANRLLLLPVPAAGHTVAFEYASKRFVYDPSGDTYGPEFTTNDSVSVLDSDLIMQGVRWRWKLVKGFPYAEEKRIHELDVLNASSRDSGKKTLSLGGGNSVLAGRRRSGDLTTSEL
jgi:hypothetical protein